MSPVLPPLSVHTPTRTTNAKIEFSALPGTLLGGPYTTGRSKAGCQRVRPDDLGPLHLAYLRAAYQQDPAVRDRLDALAAQHRYGHNHIAIYVLDEPVGENVLHAIRGLAARLPARTDLDAVA